MGQAIETKYVGPTNHRGARIVVKAQAARMVFPWDDALSCENNHYAAVAKFTRRLEWDDDWIGGERADGSGYVFVCDKKRTSLEKDKCVIEKNNNLIDVAHIESLIAQYVDGLAMDDAEDRESMALFIMERIVCPMRARLDALAKANKKFHGFMHADEVAAALFGE